MISKELKCPFCSFTGEMKGVAISEVWDKMIESAKKIPDSDIVDFIKAQAFYICPQCRKPFPYLYDEVAAINAIYRMLPGVMQKFKVKRQELLSDR